MIRQYERVNGDTTESVLVHITPDGYVKMTEQNMHEVLTHIGYRETTKETA